MTVDLSAFDATADASRPANRCSVHQTLEDMPPDKADAFRAAMDGQYTNVVVAKTVSSWGYRMTPYTVSRHRKRECACD